MSFIICWQKYSCGPDSFGIEYIPQKVANEIKRKTITHKIYTIQSDDSIMCEFFCIAFIEYTIAGKTLSGYINFFSPNDYQKNDKIIYKYFEEKYVKRFVFVSVFSGCVSISVFASLVAVPVGTGTSAVGLKFVHQLEELKSICESSRRREKSVVKLCC